MSHFAVHISTDGAAFGDLPEYEVSRILRELADTVETGEEFVRLRDVNGNRVGFATFNAPDEEPDTSPRRHVHAGCPLDCDEL